MTKVFTPSNKDAVSVRKIQTTENDRMREREQFNEKRTEQDRIKTERFEKIRERRKRKPGGGGGINIEIKSE